MDADKQAIKQAGLPQAVINDLNTAVQQGLLLPSFKYYDEVKFLENPPHAGQAEARTVVLHARQVDDGWNLSRRDCDALCVNYQIVAELTQKYYLKRWSKYLKKESHFPKTHLLLVLKNEIVKCKYDEHVVQGCPDAALEYITQCGEGTKYKNVVISCSEFYEKTQLVDPYLMSLWGVMKDCPPKRPIDGTSVG